MSLHAGYPLLQALALTGVAPLFASPVAIGAAAGKAVLLVTVGLAGLRLGKPRMLGRLAPVDIITLAAMGAAIGRSATASSTSFSEGAAVVLALVFVHRVVSMLRRWGWFRRLVERPVEIVVKDGVVLGRALARSGMTADDLTTALRRQGLTSLDEVALALYEPTGEVTVLSADNGTPNSTIHR